MIAAARLEVSGILGHPRYDCPVCIMSGNNVGRNCTGGPLIYHDAGVSIDHRNPPRPVRNPVRPAYPDGWADVAREASELGIKNFDQAFSGPDYFEPLPNCLRLFIADGAVIDWLRLYASITFGLRTPPVDVPPYYDRIMLGVHKAVTAQRGQSNG